LTKMRRPVFLLFLLFVSGVLSSSYKFAIITDLHIGRGTKGDYHGEDTQEVKNLRLAISTINARVKMDPSLKFTLVMGDLTDKAQQAQFDTVASLLNTLSTPFLPVIGNHDLLDYSSTHKEKNPTGDLKFAKAFGGIFSNFTQGTIHSYSGLKPVQNPEHGITSHFQNWAMSIGDTLYLALDWCSRGHGPVRAATDAVLHDFPGGTYQWLNETLASFASTSSHHFVHVVLLQHHPFHCPDGIGWYACFTEEKMSKFRSLVESYVGASPRGALPPLSAWNNVFAGHIHRWYDNTAFTGGKWSAFRQWETSAMLTGNAISIVTVTDGAITAFEKIDH